MADSAGKKTGKAISSSAKNVVDWMGNVGDFAWDGMKELGRSGVVSAIDTVDMLEEVPKFVVDMATNALTGGNGTNLGEGKSYMDKQFADARDTLQNIDVSDSKWSETPEGKATLDVVSYVPALAGGRKALLSIVKGALKMAPSALKKFSKVPGATEELKKLVALGNKVEQSQVDDFIKKFGPKVVGKAKESVNETHSMAKKLAGMLDGKTIEEVAEIAKKDSRMGRVLKYMKDNKFKTVSGAATATLTGLYINGAANRNDDAQPLEADAIEDKDGMLPPIEKQDPLEKKPESTTVRESGTETEKPGAQKEPQSNVSVNEFASKNPRLNVRTSIVDYMKARGMDSSMANRKKVAEEFGIKNYSGSRDQNIELYKRITQGK